MGMSRIAPRGAGLGGMRGGRLSWVYVKNNEPTRAIGPGGLKGVVSGVECWHGAVDRCSEQAPLKEIEPIQCDL